jgi:hypothetical protein
MSAARILRTHRARSRAAALVLVLSAMAGCATFQVRAPSAVRTDCATAAVVGLRWSPASDGPRAQGYRILRNGEPLGATAESSFADATVDASTTYTYVIDALGAFGGMARSAPLTVTTAPALPNGDAPYCPSPLIRSMAWDWTQGYRAAEGSDLWPVTWGRDGDVYAFFGDGGGFGGDDVRGRTSFGIAVISGRPPLDAAVETNLYGGLEARHPARLSGKARSIIAIGADFYAIAGIYRSTDPKGHRPQPISGAPEHVELAYSLHDAYSWQDSAWTFCDSDADGGFCPSGFVNFGPGNSGAPDRYVYLFGTSPAAEQRLRESAPAARTYLARVDRRRILTQSAYRYFAGLDSRSRPVWSADVARMQPIFTDRNAPQPGCGGRCGMAGELEDAVFDAGLGRYIGVAQGGLLAQTSFYEAPHPWGPWSTISYNNIEAATGGGGWGNLGVAAGESLGVHPVNAWTSKDGRTMWMTYSSSGKAPAGALFPPPGSGLDAFHLLRSDLVIGASP